VYNFRRFFVDIRGFIVKNWLYIYDSKYCPSLATTFSHLSGSVRILHRKNYSFFEVIHVSIQLWFHHKNVSVGQPGRMPLIETNDNRREQCLENTAGGIGLPISTFPSMFWPILQHAGRALSCCKITLSCFPWYCGRLSFNARLKCINCFRYRSPVIVSDALAAHNTLRYELVPSNTEH